MKRKVASRQLKRTCFCCNCGFKKGEVYYIVRNVYADEFGVSAYEYLKCVRCRYKEIERDKRFVRLKEKCHHPITHTMELYAR